MGDTILLPLVLILLRRCNDFVSASVIAATDVSTDAVILDDDGVVVLNPKLIFLKTAV